MVNIKYLLLFCCFFIFTSLSSERVSQPTRNKLQHELSILGLVAGNEVVIRTFKQESRLELWMRPKNQKHFILFRTYPICYYSGRLGPKLRKGDKVTPEGFYGIKKRDLNPYSRFYLSMDIGYPNTYDQQLSRSGSLIQIHGACDAVGCFAMSNLQIEEIYYLVEQALLKGQAEVPVHSFPFHMTDKNLSRHKNSRWYKFWQQLQVGYKLFNWEKIPPIIKVLHGKYWIVSSVK